MADLAVFQLARLLITDAIRSGLPPHIAQVIAGHADINTRHSSSWRRRRVAELASTYRSAFL
ncbi:hypothetical protein [Streptomyces cellulosae]|uniref:hypothetical protein n=1 Tax=Streptomyces cellulosae TaxID=1968 RepID=UPI00099D0770|nr:hypothetical protein [Streptomyces cellulosae]